MITKQWMPFDEQLTVDADASQSKPTLHPSRCVEPRQQYFSKGRALALHTVWVREGWPAAWTHWCRFSVATWTRVLAEACCCDVLCCRGFGVHTLLHNGCRVAMRNR